MGLELVLGLGFGSGFGSGFGCGCVPVDVDEELEGAHAEHLDDALLERRVRREAQVEQRREERVERLLRVRARVRARVRGRARARVRVRVRVRVRGTVRVRVSRAWLFSSTAFSCVNALKECSPWYAPMPLAPTPPKGSSPLAMCMRQSLMLRAPEVVRRRMVSQNAASREKAYSASGLPVGSPRTSSTTWLG